MKKKALIIVDMQNDFCPGGALAVKEGDLIVALINKLQNKFDLVVATQDWHPKNHKSFASNNGKKIGEVIDLNGLKQILWPDHCVQGSAGAALRKDLDTTKIQKIFQKGTDPSIDSYSGFFDNGHKKATGLGEYLKKQGVDSVYVVGLATDYCVKFTALDAVESGFKTFLIVDACRGVNLSPGDVDLAVEQIEKRWGENCKFGANMKNNKSLSQVYYEMRDKLLHINPQEFQLRPTKELPTVYGVVMEIGYPDAAVTLFSLAEETVSLYFESGGGYIGLGTHKNIWEKAYQFLLTAEKFIDQCEPTKDFQLAEKGRVKFYLLTFNGILVSDFPHEELSESDHRFFELYFTGHEVIGEIRSMDEQNKLKRKRDRQTIQ